MSDINNHERRFDDIAKNSSGTQAEELRRVGNKSRNTNLPKCKTEQEDLDEILSDKEVRGSLNIGSRKQGELSVKRQKRSG